MVANVRLASTFDMPLVGFGLWNVPAEKAADTVYNAILVGYRLFDGAYDYANERECGEGIKRAIEEGLVKREDIFVVTKLWNNYHRREHALAQAKAQNEAWGLGYIDLYLIHFPIALKYVSPDEVRYPGWWQDKEHTITETDNVPLRETWQALEEIVDLGTARSIGVSNVQAQTLYDLRTYARHPVSVLQVEHHPYLVQPDLVTLAQRHKVAVTAYFSFGPKSFSESPPAFRARTEGVPLLWDVDVVRKAAARAGRTPAQVLLRWATQRGIAVIPKSSDGARLAENLAACDFDLQEEEIGAISALDKGLRFNDPGSYLDMPIPLFA